MKKALSILVSFLVAVVLAGTAVAAEKKPKVIQKTGEVAAIDVAAKSLTIKPVKYKDTIAATINENTLVKMNRKKKSLTDIKVGDTVTVWIFEKDNIAKSIEIKPAKPEKAEPAKPAKK
ncbi:MAG TPA: hypothetical protein DHV16_06485 [Nitrospiraceae bacterium]|nr:MAG: hypothetical protein A2Z82_02745 [Nitrospirae bacterium GWA2_46_11]OGW24827.1 MAG: hypothetical protein A2X55_08020 [Nitrospirae bacterium GWB2_47_37]HCZ11890.1 hypothetical protein [Nitrospiraceae bacterium]